MAAALAESTGDSVMPNISRACALSELQPNLQTLVQNQLQPGEVARQCWQTEIMPRTKSFLDQMSGLRAMTKLTGYFAYAITEQNLIYASHSDAYWRNTYVDSSAGIRLLDIPGLEREDNDVVVRPIGSRMIRCSFVDHASYQSFATALQAAINRAKQTVDGSDHLPRTIEQRLQVLDDLVAKGRITQAEFQELRRSILSEI